MNLAKAILSYMAIAEVWAQNSRAQRSKVGCIIVKDHMIISDGYNGTPSGFQNNCETKSPNGDLITKAEVLHAESNAICKLAKSTQSSEGAILYTTMAPCFECSKLIIQSGISKVYYKDSYRNSSGIELLKRAKVETRKVE